MHMTCHVKLMNTLTVIQKYIPEDRRSVTEFCVFVSQGDIQQLLIMEDPRAAETYCQDYIPDCDAQLPYNSILVEAEEVRPFREEAERESCTT